MIDWEHITPTEVFRKFPKHRKKMLSLKILKLVDDEKTLNGKAFVIPSFRCTKYKGEKKIREWFPYYHQVFWYLLAECKDIVFALSELERISNSDYTFPNGTMIEIDKRKSLI